MVYVGLALAAILSPVLLGMAVIGLGGMFATRPDRVSERLLEGSTWATRVPIIRLYVRFVTHPLLIRLVGVGWVALGAWAVIDGVRAVFD